MSNLADLIAEDRRLVILRLLSEADRYTLNESTLRTAAAHIGHHAGRDEIRADLEFLERHRLVRLERLDVASGVLMVAHLSGDGEEVAGGRPHVGVARRGAS